MKINIASKTVAAGIFSIIVGCANASKKSNKINTISLGEDNAKKSELPADNTDGVDALDTYFPTFSPTVSPVPTASSAPSPSCVDGMNVEVKILTDGYPDETAWSVYSVAECGEAEEVMSSGGFDKFTQEKTWYRQDECLPLGQYIFTLVDSYGDGLQGSYVVQVDGVTVISGGGREEFVTVSKTFSNKGCLSSKAGKASRSKAGKASGSNARKNEDDYSLVLEGDKIAAMSMSTPVEFLSM